MKIIDVQGSILKLPYKSGPQVPGSDMTPQLHAVNMLVKIKADEEIVGIGEGPAGLYRVPGAYETPELQQVMLSNFREQLLGENPLNIRNVMDKLDTIPGFHHSKAAIDMALHDLKGRYLGVAVYSLLGGKVRDQVKAEWSIWRSQSASELVEEARWAVAEGHEYLEVKVGGGLDVGSDIERVQAVRDAVGSNVKIKADFNQGYLGEGGSAAQFNAVLRFVEALGHRTLDYIEQPLPYWDLDGLVALRRKINVPIILDESIYDPQSLSEVVKRGAADAAHLKVIKGGFLKLQEMIAIADAAGLTIIPGGGVPSGVGLAAIHQYVASFSSIQYGTHGSRFRLFEEDIVTRPVPIQPIVEVSNTPGLGVELDEEAVRRYAK